MSKCHLSTAELLHPGGIRGWESTSAPHPSHPTAFVPPEQSPGPGALGDAQHSLSQLQESNSAKNWIFSPPQKKKSWAAPEQLEPCPGRVPCVFPDALLFLLKLCQAFFRQEGRENNPWPHLKPFRVSLPRESSDSPQPRGLCTVHFALSFREATEKRQKSTKYDKNLTRSIFLSRGDGNNELCRA